MSRAHRRESDETLGAGHDFARITTDCSVPAERSLHRTIKDFEVVNRRASLTTPPRGNRRQFARLNFQLPRILRTEIACERDHTWRPR
jgi:hypothetical protein